jgi:ribosomal protein S16
MAVKIRLARMGAKANLFIELWQRTANFPAMEDFWKF